MKLDINYYYGRREHIVVALSRHYVFSRECVCLCMSSHRLEGAPRCEHTTRSIVYIVCQIVQKQQIEKIGACVVMWRLWTIIYLFWRAIRLGWLGKADENDAADRCRLLFLYAYTSCNQNGAAQLIRRTQSTMANRRRREQIFHLPNGYSISVYTILSVLCVSRDGLSFTLSLTLFLSTLDNIILAIISEISCKLYISTARRFVFESLMEITVYHNGKIFSLRRCIVQLFT